MTDCIPSYLPQLLVSKHILYFRCGYVLQPHCLNDPIYDPFDKRSLVGVNPMTISLTVSILSSSHMTGSLTVSILSLSHMTGSLTVSTLSFSYITISFTLSILSHSYITISLNIFSISTLNRKLIA